VRVEDLARDPAEAREDVTRAGRVLATLTRVRPGKQQAAGRGEKEET
jgi:hypothetical protein